MSSRERSPRLVPASSKAPSTGANANRAFDRIVGAEEPGLGSGLDQAEETQLGITDEEFDETTRSDDDR